MSVVINTNSSAITAANNLATSNAMRPKSLNRLSRGTKVVSPPDNGRALAYSIKLSAAARRQGAVAITIGDTVSLPQTRGGALKVSGKILERMKARGPRSRCSNKN